MNTKDEPESKSLSESTPQDVARAVKAMLLDALDECEAVADPKGRIDAITKAYGALAELDEIIKPAAPTNIVIQFEQEGPENLPSGTADPLSAIAVSESPAYRAHPYRLPIDTPMVVTEQEEGVFSIARDESR